MLFEVYRVLALAGILDEKPAESFVFVSGEAVVSEPADREGRKNTFVD